MNSPIMMHLYFGEMKYIVLKSHHTQPNLDNCSLNIIAKSRKYWGFLSSAKRTPFYIITCFLHTLKKEGKNFIELRIDEEGTISRSTEFTSIIIDEFPSIQISTTGG